MFCISLLSKVVGTSLNSFYIPVLLGHSTFIEIFLFEPTLETEGECGSENWEDSLGVPCSGPEQKHLAGFY